MSRKYNLRKTFSVLLSLIALFSVIIGLNVTVATAATAWAPNVWYNVGDQVTYNGVTYQCIQAHTSLVGWEPPIVPALWQPVSAGATPTVTKTPTSSKTPTATKTPTPTKTPSGAVTPTVTKTPTPTRSVSPTKTPTSSPNPNQLVWAGVRESKYGAIEGIGSFPSASGWANAMNHMASHWSGSTPAAIWLVGEVDFGTTGTTLQFTKPAGTYDSKISFDPSGVDHEGCLTYFDTRGIKVFLQIEPGFASVTDQINAVLTKFGSHPCVAGFAIDVEWYKNASDGGTNAAVSDSLAQQWETLVKSYNSNYKLVLKHFEESYLPPTYRGQIIFCCDDEQNGNLSTFLSEHRSMANFCYPNPVIYQIGYPSDRTWWGTYSDPPKSLGDALLANTPSGQQCGVIWVDFSLDILPH